MQQKITVFGGSGFVGRHLVRRLAAKGCEVRVAVRDIEAAQFLKTSGNVGQIVLWQTDIRDQAQVANAVAGADGVINLVGVLYEKGRSSFSAIHVEGARNIAHAAAAAGVKQLVQLSALGADKSGESVYSRTKALGEDAVRAAFPQAIIMRPGVIFGPEDHFFNLFAGISRFSPVMPVFGCPLIPGISVKGDHGLNIDVDLYGDGGTKLQPVYVGDVAEAIVVALDNTGSAGKTYELGGPTVYSFKEIMELLGRYTGRKKWLLPIPFGIATIYAFFLQMLPKPLFTCDQIIQLKSDNIVSENAETLDSLGIKPESAEVILPAYLSRFRTGGKEAFPS
jgi:NADH dehydrogenase